MADQPDHLIFGLEKYRYPLKTHPKSLSLEREGLVYK
ncbi:MAG: hypothetical protein UR28_C0011G0002 [Candidatus Peregrinibacteria bacterium GW2011_GWF2_33_10]|nr:MAG: hypothetical protein UR28_C0011G0002 [Candidatus Peregrinibacteria bacterium GW2011_GWF2_33_10]